MADPVVLVATMVAEPGQEELVEKTLTAAAPEASREALGAHMKGAAMRQVGAVLAQALAGPPDMVFLDAIPAGDPDAGTV
ncbi:MULTISPECIES: antibiotic biosynthesis monooxygenase [unclassified Streptomyces]|uniref:putative quinol monooxygenase n=1 Tax=unclassified Streptomyces TaxID=2593676 RepID=UPI0033AAA83B